VDNASYLSPARYLKFCKACLQGVGRTVFVNVSASSPFWVPDTKTPLFRRGVQVRRIVIIESCYISHPSSLLLLVYMCVQFCRVKNLNIFRTMNFLLARLIGKSSNVETRLFLSLLKNGYFAHLLLRIINNSV
jgi:hypothetical protein